MNDEKVLGRIDQEGYFIFAEPGEVAAHIDDDGIVRLVKDQKLFHDKPWLTTNMGKEFTEDVREVLKSLFKKWIMLGASPREMSFIIMDEVIHEQSHHALNAQVITAKVRKCDD